MLGDPEAPGQLFKRVSVTRQSHDQIVRPGLARKDCRKSAHDDVLTLSRGDVADGDQDTGVLQVELPSERSGVFWRQSPKAPGVRAVGNHRLPARSDAGLLHPTPGELADAHDGSRLPERPANQASLPTAPAAEVGSVAHGDPGQVSPAPTRGSEQDRAASRGKQRVGRVSLNPAAEDGLSIERLEGRSGDPPERNDRKRLRRVESADLLVGRVVLRREDDGLPSEGAQTEQYLMSVRPNAPRPGRKFARNHENPHQMALAERPSAE